MSMPFEKRQLRIIAIRYSLLPECDNARIIAADGSPEWNPVNFPKKGRNLRDYNSIQPGTHFFYQPEGDH